MSNHMWVSELTRCGLDGIPAYTKSYHCKQIIRSNSRMYSELSQRQKLRASLLQNVLRDVAFQQPDSRISINPNPNSNPHSNALFKLASQMTSTPRIVPPAGTPSRMTQSASTEANQDSDFGTENNGTDNNETFTVRSWRTSALQKVRDRACRALWRQKGIPLDEVVWTLRMWSKAFNIRVNPVREATDVLFMMGSMDPFIHRVNANLLDSYFELKALGVLNNSRLTRNLGHICFSSAALIKRRKLKILHGYLESLDANDALMTSIEDLRRVAKETQPSSSLSGIRLKTICMRAYLTRRSQKRRNRIRNFPSGTKLRRKLNRAADDGEWSADTEINDGSTTRSELSFSTSNSQVPLITSSDSQLSLANLASAYLANQSARSKLQEQQPIRRKVKHK